MKWNSSHWLDDCAIDTCLKANSTISKFDLQCNSILEKSAENLKQVLAYNTTLTTLSIYTNFLGNSLKICCESILNSKFLTSVTVECPKSIPNEEEVVCVLEQLISRNIIKNFSFSLPEKMAEKCTPVIFGALTKNNSISCFKWKSALSQNDVLIFSEIIAKSTHLTSIKFGPLGGHLPMASYETLKNSLMVNMSITSINISTAWVREDFFWDLFHKNILKKYRVSFYRAPSSQQISWTDYEAFSWNYSLIKCRWNFRNSDIENAMAVHENINKGKK